jgi:hypothetical protein
MILKMTGESTMRVQVKMDRDLPEGLGVVLDQSGNEIARIPVPDGKRPPGAHTLVLSVEDYARFMLYSSRAS